MSTPTLHRALTWIALALPIGLAGLLALGNGCNVTPGGDDDDDDASDDDDDDDDGPSIYELQQDGFTENQLVTLTDVVVTTWPCDSGFFVQEPEGGPWSGLYVYTYSDVIDQLDIAPGDIVSVTGAMAEYYEMTELTLTNTADVEVTGATDAPTPEAIDLGDLTDDATAEPWESVLVTVGASTVTSTPDNYGEWAIDGVTVDDGCQPFDPVVGTEVLSLTGVVDYAWEHWRLSPRTESDVEWGEIATPDVVTIPDIQQGNVDPGPVTIENVIVTSGATEPYSSCNWAGFWVQDPAGGAYSGIYVAFNLGDIADPGVAIGDTVTLTGGYEEFYDVSQITLADAADLTIHGSGPAPSSVVIGDPCGADLEMYEGVLVQITDPAGDVDVTTAVDDDSYGEFVVEGCLKVDDIFFEFTDCGAADMTPQPPLGTTCSYITGPLHYAYGEYKVEPRDLDDFACDGWP